MEFFNEWIEKKRILVLGKKRKLKLLKGIWNLEEGEWSLFIIIFCDIFFKVNKNIFLKLFIYMELIFLLEIFFYVL